MNNSILKFIVFFVLILFSNYKLYSMAQNANCSDFIKQNYTSYVFYMGSSDDDGKTIPTKIENLPKKMTFYILNTKKNPPFLFWCNGSELKGGVSIESLTMSDEMEFSFRRMPVEDSKKVDKEVAENSPSSLIDKLEKRDFVNFAIDYKNSSPKKSIQLYSECQMEKILNSDGSTNYYRCRNKEREELHRRTFCKGDVDWDGFQFSKYKYNKDETWCKERLISDNLNGWSSRPRNKPRYVPGTSGLPQIKDKITSGFLNELKKAMQE